MENFNSLLVEDYPQGYPHFCALIGAHPAFSLCRKFIIPRTHLLLVKQDRVSVLEKQLRDLDQEEQKVLSLGSLRRDCNQRRKELLVKLDHALKDYSMTSADFGLMSAHSEVDSLLSETAEYWHYQQR